MNDFEELNTALNEYTKTIIGVPLTKVDVAARFMIYSSLMKQYGIDRMPIMIIVDKMPIQTKEVPRITSKLVN